MAETSTSSECGLGGKLELSRQGAAQRLSGGRNRKYRRSEPMVGQTHIRVPRLNLFELLRRRRAIEPTCDMRALFCLVGIVIGISGSLSSALAAVEEATSQDGSASDYAQSALSQDSIVNFWGDSYDSITRKFDNNHSPFNVTYNEDKFGHYGTNTTIGRDRFGSSANLDGVFIPDAVWSLDVSTGVHLDHISNDSGFGFGIAVGSDPTTPDVWTRAVLGLWADNNTQGRSDVVLLSPPQLQVASCGGTSAEHPDLDRCGSTYNSTDQSTGDSKKAKPNNGTDASVAPNNSSGTVTGSNGPSAPNQGAQPGAALDLSPLMRASFNNFAVQGDLTSVSNLLDQCDGAFASCATTQINSPTEQIDVQTAPIDAPVAPIDASVAPIDDLTAPIGDSTAPGSSPSNPVTSIVDPGHVPDLLPIFVPPASPIPETSTEVMTMIGFAIMFLASRRRTLNSIKHGVVGAFYKVAKKSLHHSSV